MGDIREDCEVRGAWCQMCGPTKCMCYTRCYIKDGVWKYVEGCPNAANNGEFGSVSLCAKGMAAPSSLNSSERLLYPMKRIGPKGPGAQFERISWDEALDTISQTLLRQKKEYGPESFGVLSPQFFSVLAIFGRRFLNVHGSPNYLHSAICHVQRVVSAASVLGPGGGRPGTESNTIPVQLDKTQLLVNWGGNPENAGVNHGHVRRRLDEKNRGMRIIDIRPLCDPMASKADIWLPIRPGTDLALALGFLHVICGEGLFDHDFVQDWCYGFEELCDHVKKYTPEWTEHHCGIPADQIREVARMIASAKPCGISYGNGVGDQSRDGHWTVVAINLIGAICGNIGKPGGGSDYVSLPPLIRFDPRFKNLPDSLQQDEEDKANGWRGGVSRLVAPEFPRWYQGMSSNLPTSSYFRGIMSVLTEEPYPLKAIFAQSTNPLSATRQPELVAKALEKVEFFFVMDMFHNPSCDYADIVLPAASQYECSHLLAMKNFPEGTFLGLSQKIADPPGEAMSDWEFYLKLAVKMGYGDYFWNGDMEAYLEEMVAPTGYSVDELRNTPDGVFVPRSSAKREDGSNSIADAEPDYASMFASLPHGKVQCVNEVMGGKLGFDGETVMPFLPEYQGPAEGIAESPDIAKDYPYAFSDVHAHRLANHSYFGDVAQVRRFAEQPWVKINPKTALKNGIEDGDWVEIESPHGWCVLQAQLTEGVSPDVLMGRRGWWQGCPSLDIPGYHWGNGGAEVNVLYSGDHSHTDSFHGAHDKQTLVRIRKHEGKGPLVYVPSDCQERKEGE